MTATEVSQEGGLSQSYLSELKNGKKNPKTMEAETIVCLARGMGESPVTILYLANEIPTTRLDDHVLEQVLRDYAKLDDQARERNEYLIKQLRRVVKDELRSA